MKNKHAFIAIFICIFCIAFIVPDYFFPSDVLNYFPSFTQDSWQRPHNSLLADPVFQFEPWRAFAKEALMHGTLPLWNPLNGSGAPFLANPQTAILFPLNFLYYVFPIGPSLFLIHAFKLFLLFLFSYLYLRIIHCSGKISFLGASAITFSGFSLTWILWPQMNVFLFLPLFLFITEKIVQKKNTYRWFFLLSVTYALAFFGGHPETLFHITIIHFFYNLFRLSGQPRILFKSCIFIFLGFCLAAIQLFPFIEYLSQSFALLNRQQGVPGNTLPLAGVVLLLIPFLFGAPHEEFYRSINSHTNFQEMIGGYVGTIILLLAFYGACMRKKNKLIIFWSTIAVFCFGISYHIFPFSIVSKLPLFDMTANQRLIGFMGFSLVIIASLVLEKLRSGDRFSFRKKMPLLTLICFLLVLFVGVAVVTFRNISVFPQGFVTSLALHFLLLILSTYGFFLALFSFKKYTYILLLFFLFLQTGLLFWNYIPFTKPEEYYPKTLLIEKLQSLPQGAILEVGNPALKEESNVMFGLQHVENYDALEIATYKKSFDRAFPVKNHWGKVEEISLSSIHEFGIRYIIADHDIRLTSVKLQAKQDAILPRLTQSRSYKVVFKPPYQSLRQIRFLMANFNRLNTCSFDVSVVHKGQTIFSKRESCRDVRDKMYYTVELTSVELDPNESYTIFIQSQEYKDSNSVAFWGNRQGQPYIEVLFDRENKLYYRLLAKWKDVFLFNVPSSSWITYPGKYTLLQKENEQIKLLTTAEKEEVMQIKIPNYVGWRLETDGLPGTLQKERTFLTFNIPAGKHVVTLSYQPLSFFMGTILSTITFLSLLIYFIHNERSRKWWKSLDARWESWSNAVNKIPLERHVVIIGLGTVVGVVAAITAAKLFPYTGGVPKTTAINWLTVHKYPKLQDTYYFLLFLLTIVLTSIVLWFFFVWKKTQKPH